MADDLMEVVVTEQLEVMTERDQQQVKPSRLNCLSSDFDTSDTFDASDTEDEVTVMDNESEEQDDEDNEQQFNLSNCLSSYFDTSDTFDASDTEEEATLKKTVSSLLTSSSASTCE